MRVTTRSKAKRLCCEKNSPMFYDINDYSPCAMKMMAIAMLATHSHGMVPAIIATRDHFTMVTIMSTIMSLLGCVASPSYIMSNKEKDFSKVEEAANSDELCC